MAAKIIMAGTDVTKDLSPYLIGIDYEDKLSGEADTLTIELNDAARRFIGDWFPQRGDTLDVELSRINFNGDGRTERLPLGEFEVDEISNSFPPSRCRIKAVSISQNSHLRQHDYSKSWENVKLSEIAQEVAQAAGLELIYRTEDDPQITRAEQGESSTLGFLMKICADNGLALKVDDKKLIIFDETELEKQEPVKIFDRESSTILHFDARATINEIYGSCEVNYRNAKQAENYSAKFDAPDATSDKVLRINQRCDSQAAAEKLAKKKLRDKNKDEIKVSLDVVGDFVLVAGSCVELKNCGFYAGKYIIERAAHSIGDGYTVRLELRKCLNGY